MPSSSHQDPIIGVPRTCPHNAYLKQPDQKAALSGPLLGMALDLKQPPSIFSRYASDFVQIIKDLRAKIQVCSSNQNDLETNSVRVMVRIKHRYLLFNILYPDQIRSMKPTSDIPLHVSFHAPSPSHLNAPLLLAYLRSSISTHFGDCGLGLTSATLKIIYFSPATSTAIVRCPRAHFRLVWAALTFMDQMPGVRKGDRGRNCVIQVVRVSGTIRKSEEELIRRARREVVWARAAEEGRLDELIGKENLNTNDRQKGKSRTSQLEEEYWNEDIEDSIGNDSLDKEVESMSE